MDSGSILSLPCIRAIFEGGVQAVFRDDGPLVSIIVYVSNSESEEDRKMVTLGLLDHARQLYFELSFRDDRITDCRKYTPDNFSHGVSFESFRQDYLDVLCERLTGDLKRRLFGLFLPGDQGLDRHVGGFFFPYIDRDGVYREKSIEVENAYL